MLENSCSLSSDNDLSVDADLRMAAADAANKFSASDGSHSIVVDSALCKVDPSFSIWKI